MAHPSTQFALHTSTPCINWYFFLVQQLTPDTNNPLRSDLPDYSWSTWSQDLYRSIQCISTVSLTWSFDRRRIDTNSRTLWSIRGRVYIRHLWERYIFIQQPNNTFCSSRIFPHSSFISSSSFLIFSIISRGVNNSVLWISVNLIEWSW